jgi:hypothetical protein
LDIFQVLFSHHLEKNRSALYPKYKKGSQFFFSWHHLKSLLALCRFPNMYIIYWQMAQKNLFLEACQRKIIIVDLLDHYLDQHANSRN